MSRAKTKWIKRLASISKSDYHELKENVAKRRISIIDVKREYFKLKDHS